MRFSVYDRFDAPRARVEEAILELEYQKRLEALPNVAERDVVEQVVGADGLVHRVVYYRFAGSVPTAVKAAIGADSISWDERAVFDPARNEWRFEIHPHVAKEKFTCGGWIRFSDDGDATTRSVDVDLQIHVPIVGRMVENAIADGLRQTLEAEARILSDYLSERPV